MPLNVPKASGLELILSAYVDTDLAGDKITRRSRPGYIIFSNIAPIVWYSKKQGSSETGIFGS